MSEFSRDEVWIPSVPLPLQGWRTDRCSCGRRFKGKNRRVAYELHWRVEHEPETLAEATQVHVCVARIEAIEIYEEVRAERERLGCGGLEVEG